MEKKQRVDSAFISCVLSASVKSPSPGWSKSLVLFSAVGTDNMFLMVAALRRTNRANPVEQRIGNALADAAISILITALTDAFSFGVGSFTRYGRLQAVVVRSTVSNDWKSNIEFVFSAFPRWTFSAFTPVWLYLWRSFIRWEQSEPTQTLIPPPLIPANVDIGVALFP